MTTPGTFNRNSMSGNPALSSLQGYLKSTARRLSTTSKAAPETSAAARGTSAWQSKTSTQSISEWIRIWVMQP